MKKIYIIGKISGIETEAEQMFSAVEKELKKAKYKVVNPMKLKHNHDKTWESYMKVCIPAMLKCDAVALINNFTQSRGAMIEFNLAVQMNMEIIHLIPKPTKI